MLHEPPGSLPRSALLRPFERARRSPLLRIMLIGFLVILLQIPIAMIQGLIWERQATGQEAVGEVTGKWGYQQSVLGPRIVVPYNQRVTEVNDDGKTITRTFTRQANFLPATLDVTGSVATQVRYRGIFHVPVYRASLQLRGRFAKPSFEDWGVDATDVIWDRAQLIVQISDARAIQEPTSLKWNGLELPFVAGTGDLAGGAGIHVALKGQLAEESFEFAFPLELNGSAGIFFAPFGDQSNVHLKSDWKDPSFTGNWLPATREVGPEGFDATWKIPSLGRNFPQRWVAEDGRMEQAISGSQVGIDFLSPINAYRMAERSVKYQALFLVLTFMTIWLFEVLVKVRVHPVQYLLVGAAMCLFYLLELSLAEHFGFVAAYVIAAAAVVAQIAGYSIAVLRGFRRASILGAVVAVLYGYLYVLLMNQDYSLLFGSVGLFIVLGIVMALTRRIDWYDPTSEEAR